MALRGNVMELINICTETEEFIMLFYVVFVIITQHFHYSKKRTGGSGEQRTNVRWQCYKMTGKKKK